MDGFCLWCGELVYIVMFVVSFFDMGGVLVFMVLWFDGDFVSIWDLVVVGVLILLSMCLSLFEKGLFGVVFVWWMLGFEKNVGLLVVWNLGYVMLENVDEISWMVLVLIG